MSAQEAGERIRECLRQQTLGELRVSDLETVLGTVAILVEMVAAENELHPETVLAIADYALQARSQE